MGRRQTLVLSSLLFPLLLSGCYARQWVREPIVVEENAEAIADVIARQDELDAKLSRIEANVGDQLNMIREMRAGQVQYEEEIRTTLLAMRELFTDSRGQIEDVAGRIDRVLRRQTERARETAPEGDTTAVAAAAIDPQPLYNAAYLDLIRGNYATALLGFESFLAAYPAGALADDARYWVGECYFAEGNPEEAIVQFERLEDDFPDSERLPPSLLKLGSCYRELGRGDEARKVLTRLLEEYPRSVEAPLAEEMMKELG